MTDIKKEPYDVVVIGAGGAGLRAAIEARLAGKRTAVISKSLFGKAHTVMAEGGAGRKQTHKRTVPPPPRRRGGGHNPPHPPRRGGARGGGGGGGGGGG